VQTDFSAFSPSTGCGFPLVVFRQMKIIRFLRGRMNSYRLSRARRRLRHQFSGVVDDLLREQWAGSLEDPTAFYIRCCHYFDRRLPRELRAHRRYFTRNRRGFGEDAFHVMWFLLFREFRLSNFLEIGVYRGQTLTLASLLQKRNGLAEDVAGVSPFEPAGDSVSRYREGLDYFADTLKNFDFFSLSRPVLFKAYSTDKPAVEFIGSRAWDCLYIDGNHDYEIARADWQVCAESAKPGGLIVLDDSGLGTRYHPPIFATGGHPGPSQVAREIDRSRFCELLQVGHNRVFQKISS
jgi:hypothetical protein